VAEFLAMGGYAAYVWSAFGFALAVMAALFAQSWHAARARERELAELRSAMRRPGWEAAAPAAPPAPRPLVARRENA
jgi:heme exporter protein D